jgi:hypothetical protein
MLNVGCTSGGNDGIATHPNYTGDCDLIRNAVVISAAGTVYLMDTQGASGDKVGTGVGGFAPPVAGPNIMANKDGVTGNSTTPLRWVSLGGSAWNALTQFTKPSTLPLHGTKEAPRSSVLMHDGHTEIINEFDCRNFSYRKQ